MVEFAELFMSDGVLPAVVEVPVLSEGVVALACGLLELGGVVLGVVVSGLVVLGVVVLGLFGFVVVSGLVALGFVVDGLELDCGVVVVLVVDVEFGDVVVELC